MAADSDKKREFMADVYFCLFLMALVLVFFIASLGYRNVTRNPSWVVMAPLALMTAGQLWATMKKLKRLRAEISGFSWRPDFDPARIRKGLGLLVWMLVMMVLIYLAGHAVGIGIFLLIMLKASSREKWRLAVAVAVIAPLSIYMIFEVLLRVPLNPGLVYDYLQSVMYQ